MKYIIEKRNYILLFVIIVLLFIIIFYSKRSAFVKSYKVDGLITVVIYDNIDRNFVDRGIKKILKKNYKIQDYEIDVSDYKVDGALKVLKIMSFFSKNKIKYYMINENGNVSVGSKYGDKYSVSLNLDNDVLDIVSLKNESLESVKYSSLYDGVFVIDKDNVRGYILANYLSGLELSKAKEECDYRKVNAYFIKDGDVYMTDGFKKFIN